MRLLPTTGERTADSFALKQSEPITCTRHVRQLSLRDDRRDVASRAMSAPDPDVDTTSTVDGRKDPAENCLHWSANAHWRVALLGRPWRFD
jgi:hypothetical protein